MLLNHRISVVAGRFLACDLNASFSHLKSYQLNFSPLYPALDHDPVVVSPPKARLQSKELTEWKLLLNQAGTQSPTSVPVPAQRDPSLSRSTGSPVLATGPYCSFAGGQNAKHRRTSKPMEPGAQYPQSLIVAELE